MKLLLLLIVLIYTSIVKSSLNDSGSLVLTQNYQSDDYTCSGDIVSYSYWVSGFCDDSNVQVCSADGSTVNFIKYEYSNCTGAVLSNVPLETNQCNSNAIGELSCVSNIQLPSNGAIVEIVSKDTCDFKQSLGIVAVSKTNICLVAGSDSQILSCNAQSFTQKVYKGSTTCSGTPSSYTANFPTCSVSNGLGISWLCN